MSDHELSRRIVELESRYSFLENDFRELHEVVLDLAAQIDRQNRIILKLEGRIDRMDESESDEGEEPPPPHY